MTALASLAGRRVLVVEDDMMIALLIEEVLQSLGCVVVGPVGKLDTALRLANDEAIDAAVLDVTIRGGDVFPVAERLMARSIPFALASGYGDWALPEIFRNKPRLTKPFSVQQLTARMQALCSEHGAAAPTATSLA
ncbi:MAG: response regulator [Janthinobacterium lividum]